MKTENKTLKELGMALIFPIIISIILLFCLGKVEKQTIEYAKNSNCNATVDYDFEFKKLHTLECPKIDTRGTNNFNPTSFIFGLILGNSMGG